MHSLHRAVSSPFFVPLPPPGNEITTPLDKLVWINYPGYLNEQGHDLEWLAELLCFCPLLPNPFFTAHLNPFSSFPHFSLSLTWLLATY